MPNGFDKPVPWRQELSPDARVLLAEAMERRKNNHHGIISLEPGSQSGFHSRGLLPVTERLRDTRHGQERALRSCSGGFVPVGSVPPQRTPWYAHHIVAPLP